MTKKEYEKIRQEVAKRYKDEISDLRRRNNMMNDEYVKIQEENHKLKKQIACYKKKYDELPEYIRNLMDLADIFSRL